MGVNQLNSCVYIIHVYLYKDYIYEVWMCTCIYIYLCGMYNLDIGRFTKTSYYPTSNLNQVFAILGFIQS